jgi:DNA-binding NtrC family response regulator
MNAACRVLVVAEDMAVASRMVIWLSSQGHNPQLCTGFAEAKPELDRCPPDLLVTELKLGAFNGLHLAIRAKHRQPDVRTLVLGEQNEFFEEEARRHGAYYSGGVLDEHSFTHTVQSILGPTTHDGSGRHVIA